MVGLAAALGARRLSRGLEARLDGLVPASLWSQIGIITGRFLLQGVWLMSFVAVAHLLDAVVNRAVSPDSSVIRSVIRTVGWTWFAVMAARFVVSPMQPKLRLCTVDDRTAWFLIWRIGVIFGWSALTVSIHGLTTEFGWPDAI